MADFTLVESPNLISRQIWVIEKSWNFHTVNNPIIKVEIFTFHQMILGVGDPLVSQSNTIFSPALMVISVGPFIISGAIPLTVSCPLSVTIFVLVSAVQV